MLLTEKEIPKVSVNKMNEIHNEEIKIVNELYKKILENGDLETIIALFDEFLKDVENHFSFEQSLMEKYNFFAYPMHRGEHDRVLYEFKSLEKLLKEKKNVDAIKDYLENNFKPWIINHVMTMDTVTAMYLSNFGV